MSGNLQALTISGTPFERGTQYGRAIPELITRNIAFYRNMFEAFDVSWDEAKLRAKLLEPFIKEYFEEGLDEMHGIAEGAGISFEDILTLNCRSEILFAQPDGCSSFGVLPEDSANGHVLLGQTWDWLKGARGLTVLLTIASQNQPKMLICAEAGIIGGKGLNEHGIGVCLNALSVGRGRPGVPLHIIYRSILCQNTISNALDRIAHAHRAGSGNFAIGSSEGFLMCVEFTPENFDVLMPESGPMVHTNHYLSALFKSQDTFKADLTDTFVRLNRMNRLIKSHEGKYDRATLFEFFSDHANFPDSICSHADPSDPEGKRLCTVYAIVMDLFERKLWITESSPCESEPKEFVLSL